MSDAPPQNLDAEDSVLGAMLMGSRRAISEAAEVIGPEDFYRESSGRIFQVILDLDEKNEKVDAITVSAELDRRGLLADVGGKARIGEVASLAPATSNISSYAKIVKEMSVRRSLVRAGFVIREVGEAGVGEPAELLAQAEAALSGVENASDMTDFEVLADSTTSFLEDIMKFAREGKERYGLKSHYPTLDKMLTGFHPGRLYILAARPSVGKSAFAGNVAMNVGYKGSGVMLFTLEMSKEELITRWLSNLTEIDVNSIQLAKLDLHQQQALATAATKLSGLPLYVEDNSALRMPELRARVRRHMRLHPDTGLLIVDYLQLMLASKDSESRQQEVALISRGLKLLAKELHIPVLALSQLNRGLEHRTDKRPMLSDLRDSGAIEQDADVVMFLYRDSMYSAEEDAATANDTDLIIAKNRMGDTGTVKFVFVKKRERYGEPAKTGGDSS